MADSKMVRVSKSKSSNDSKSTKFSQPILHMNGNDTVRSICQTRINTRSSVPGSVLEKLDLEQLKEATLKNMKGGVNSGTPLAKEECIEYALEVVISSLIMNGYLEPNKAHKMRSKDMKSQIAQICDEMIAAKSEIMSKATGSAHGSRSRSKSQGETISRSARIRALSRPKSQKSQKWAIQPAALPITIIANQNPLKLPSLVNIEKLAKSMQITKSLRNMSIAGTRRNKSDSKSPSKSRNSSSERDVSSTKIKPKAVFQRSVSPKTQRSISPSSHKSNSPKPRRSTSPNAKQRSISPIKSQRPSSPPHERPMTPKHQTQISPEHQSPPVVPPQQSTSVVPIAPQREKKRIFYRPHVSSEVPSSTHSMENNLKQLASTNNVISDADFDKSQVAQKSSQEDHLAAPLTKQVEDDNKNILITETEVNIYETIKESKETRVLPKENDAQPKQVEHEEEPTAIKKTNVEPLTATLGKVSPIAALGNKNLATLIKTNNNNNNNGSSTSTGYRVLVDLKGFQNNEISMEVENRQLIFLASRPKRDDLSIRKVTEIVDVPQKVNMENLKIGRRTDGSVLIEEHEA